MSWSEACGVVIPCLNEAGTIAPLVQQVRRFLPAVLVVDDGSTDGTAELAASAGAMVIRHPHQRGKGVALATGLGWIQEHGFDWALLMDGDGQHASADIPRFLESAENGHFGLVVGNRMDNADRIPWLRRHVNQWMSRRLSNLTGHMLPDSQCGFRLLRLSAWAAVHLESSHFEIESELLVAVLASGQPVRFVPIQVIYTTQRSKIRPVMDACRWFRWWSRASQGHRSVRLRSALKREPEPLRPAARRGLLQALARRGGKPV